VDGAYGEAALRLTSHWQIAGMYDHSDTELPTASAANIARDPDLLRHESWGAGLNYWFSPNLVIKSSFHNVLGNRFASPEQTNIRKAVATGTLGPRTRAFLFGAQLSF
jgi:hypothetical protein